MKASILPDLSLYLLLDGSRAMTGNLQIANNSIMPDTTNRSTLGRLTNFFLDAFINSLEVGAFHLKDDPDLIVERSTPGGNRSDWLFMWGGAEIFFAGADTVTEERFAGVFSSGYFCLPNTVRPVASAVYRGMMLYEAGGAGVADRVYVCLKSGIGTYSWITMAIG